MLRVLALQASHTVEHGRGMNRVYCCSLHVFETERACDKRDCDEWLIPDWKTIDTKFGGGRNICEFRIVLFAFSLCMTVVSYSRPIIAKQNRSPT